MGILLDPSKQFISIEIFYVEEVLKHGNSIFHFIRSADDLAEWKSKGYVVEGEAASVSPTTPSMEAKQTPDKLISKLITHWTKPIWKDQNIIISRSLKTTATGDGTVNELDGVKYRDLKLKMCLKKWNLTDEKGQVIPVEPQIIDMLEPVVAQELLSNFERVTEPTSDDLKT